jgi:hypothetical protein
MKGLLWKKRVVRHVVMWLNRESAESSRFTMATVWIRIIGSSHLLPFLFCYCSPDEWEFVDITGN